MRTSEILFMGEPLSQRSPQEQHRILVQYGHALMRPNAIVRIDEAKRQSSIAPAPKPLPANCDNCGAPTTGPVCEYCGTQHAR